MTFYIEIASQLAGEKHLPKVLANHLTSFCTFNVLKVIVMRDTSDLVDHPIEPISAKKVFATYYMKTNNTTQFASFNHIFLV